MSNATRVALASLVAEFRTVTKLRLTIWLATAAAFSAALVLLTIAVTGDTVPSQDQTVLDWVDGLRDVPLLAGFSTIISGMTGNYSAFGLGIAIIVFLWLIGMTRTAVWIAIVGGTVGFVAIGADFTLGEIVGRSRPISEDSGNSFPSGHVFGSTVFFGIAAWAAIHHGLKKKLLVPVLMVLLFMTMSVGFSRMFEMAHWPSDVLAGYLLGMLWTLVLSTSLVFLQRVSWITTPRQAAELDILECESCRVESSIASTVVLDPERGTATKVYSPPGVVRLIYWLSFQASFPYEHNRAALDAAMYRRKIASALTKHRFGKDLVAHVRGVNCDLGPCDFVTEFIPGEKVENDDEAKNFLGQVAETFAEAGLSVWQVNPRNPHAHTNLIRTPEGDFIIIDLESAVVTPIPARGQWLSALRRGNIPIFDDLDFGRLREYIAANEAGLQDSLGSLGLAELQHDVDRGEEAIHLCQDSEPRLWGRLIRGAYRLVDVKRFLMRLTHALDKGDKVAEDFLAAGISRWEAERRLSPTEIAWLRSHLNSGEVQTPIHHMGVHLVLSVVLVVPIPGLRSLARFLWTLVFWVKTQRRRLRRGASKSAEKVTNVHTPPSHGVRPRPGLWSRCLHCIPPLTPETADPPHVGPIGHQASFQALRTPAPRPKAGPGVPADVDHETHKSLTRPRRHVMPDNLWLLGAKRLVPCAREWTIGRTFRFMKSSQKGYTACGLGPTLTCLFRLS